MEEVWKDIDGYEGLYQISNYGRVRSTPRKGTKGGIINPSENRYGYSQVSLYKNGKIKVMKVHRLVANAFIPNPDNLPCINHKSEIKTQNNVDNLEWCTYEYNNNYGSKNSMITKEISQYSKNGTFIKNWKTAYKIEKELGYNNAHISACCNGKRKTAYGYIWKFENE